MSKVEAALSILLEAGDDGLVEIDRKIALLNKEIANLKRMRRLLAPAAKSGTAGGRGTTFGSFDDIGQRIVDIITEHGPLHPVAIAKHMGSDSPQMIGRVVKRCEQLAKLPTGEITLVS